MIQKRNNLLELEVQKKASVQDEAAATLPQEVAPAPAKSAPVVKEQPQVVAIKDTAIVAQQAVETVSTATEVVAAQPVAAQPVAQKPAYIALSGKVKRKFCIHKISKAVIEAVTKLYPQAEKLPQIIESLMLNAVKQNDEADFQNLLKSIESEGGAVK